MHAVKLRGGGFGLYAVEDDPQSERRVALMSELRQAIAHGQLTLAYQPKVEVATDRLVGVEALVRWRHPTRGLLLPAEFIPLAERSGLIKQLTLWVIGEALRQTSRWSKQGYEIAVAVNLSMRNLRDPLLFDGIDRLLRSSGVAPRLLELEITEGTIMAEPTRTIELLRRLRDRGMGLAIDDFGTGYSSLAYLDRLPIHELKIDRSFVVDVVHSETHAAIVRAVAELGHSFGLRVVAEGVEDRAAWDTVGMLGCDAVQGYGASLPLDAAEITTHLERGRWQALIPRRAAS
jgi:EAL domain-containing protein (putative c-di-GMP-specific phosphodiesterase class I)